MGNGIWADSWESQYEEEWFTGRSRSLPRGSRLGATLYELPPGGKTAYHFHHGNEELLVVLRGRPTLRSPEGERALEEGEVLHFPLGAQGAHGLRNDTADPVRFLIASNLASPDAVEYPDTRQLSVMAFTPSQFGAELWDIRTLEPPPE